MATEPLTLLNGTTADATDVMALFDEIYNNIDGTNIVSTAVLTITTVNF